VSKPDVNVRGPVVADLAAAAGALVHEPGWQSWSPAGTYRLTDRSPRPTTPRAQEQFYRPGKPAADGTFQGEGWIAYAPPEGPVRIWHGVNLAETVPTLSLEVRGGQVVVRADGDVVERQCDQGLTVAVEQFAALVASELGAAPVRSLPPGWSSWLAYGQRIGPEEIQDELAAMRRSALDVQVVQIDDGWFRGLGDWSVSARFGSLPQIAGPIADEGRRLGLWTAPFLVDLRGSVATAHPDWLVDRPPLDLPFWGTGGAGVLDVTNPDAAEHLHDVFAALTEGGAMLHKVDFLYAGALEGRRHADCTPVQAYRHGLSLLRQAVGPDTILLACGAPLLPSVGLADAMRVSTDAAEPPRPHGPFDPPWDPPDGDLSQPSLRGAASASKARRWQHGRWWANDAECILAGPTVSHRERWADALRGHRGLVLSGDRLAGLDARGLQLTRELLRPSSPEPMVPLATDT